MAARKISLYVVLFCIGMLTACTSSNINSAYNNVEPSRKEIITSFFSQPFIDKGEETADYQYAAPWDELMYERFYEQVVDPKIDKQIKGGIVPHHILGGKVIATFFDTLRQQKPSTIVLIGPNHFSRGNAQIITSDHDWKTPYGDLKIRNRVLDKLSEKGLVAFDDNVIAEEHSIYSLISFIKKSLPDTRVVPLIIKNDTDYLTLNRLVDSLTKELPKDTVIVSSIDFSHYQIPTAAAYHDEYTKGVIRSFDFNRLKNLEIDSVPSLYVLMKLMEQYGTEEVAYELHSSSAELSFAYDTEDTTSYYSPYFVKGDRDVMNPVSLMFFGDMMLDRSVKTQIEEHGFEWLLEEIAGEEGRFFRGMDAVHVNAEGAFGNYRRETSKSIAFNFDPSLISIFYKYAISIVTLANNHSYDMGRDAFEETKENLDKHDIAYYGEQYSVDDDALLIKDFGNKKVGFIGINDTNSPVDVDSVISLIERSEKESDITIINAHWGVEYQLKSHPRQQFLAHAFIDAGADLIIGHHPHVIQEMEVYNDRPIFYSLGNFLFDQYFSVDTQQGIAVGTVFTNDVVRVYVFPFESNKSQIDHMSYEDGSILFDRIVPDGYTKDKDKRFIIEIPLDN